MAAASAARAALEVDEAGNVDLRYEQAASCRDPKRPRVALAESTGIKPRTLLNSSHLSPRLLTSLSEELLRER